MILYHWAPADRRRSIMRRGLRLRRKPVVHSQRFGYLCFSNSPSLAWGLSAAMTRRRAKWDLWMTHLERPYRRLPTWGGRKFTEYRFFRPVPKSKLWFVGTRLKASSRK